MGRRDSWYAICISLLIDIIYWEGYSAMLSHVIHKMHQVIHPQDNQQNPDWDNAMSHMTEIEVLTEAKERLIKVDSIKPKDLIKKINIVFDLDEKAYRKVQSLTHNYLKSLNKNSELKKEVEVVSYAYLRQLYSTYTQIIVEYQQQNKSILNVEKMNLLLARYLNAAFMMAKWRYFDDQPAPLGVWNNIHKVVRVAEELSMMNKEVFLYDFQNKETSVATIMKRGFMLDTLQKGSYTQVQIELTDRVLKTWSTNPKLSNKYTTQDACQFFIHLEDDKRPQRIRGAKQHSDFRYWETARIVDLMETYLCAADTRKSLEAFNLVTMAKTNDLVCLFKKLRKDWCVEGYKRQRRDEERTAKFQMLNVSHGIDEISARIRYMQLKPSVAKSAFEGVSLELMTDGPQSKMQTTGLQSKPYGRENWAMLEESDSGFSVEIGTDINDWVKSGVLIGYSSMENSNQISLAEIRTVRKRTNGTYRIGLSKLTSNAVVIKVNKVQKPALFESVEGYVVNDGEENLSFSELFTGLFIDDNQIDKPRLIVPRHQYKLASRYKVNMNGEDHMVLAGEVVSSHREWVCFDLIV